jgi:cyclophilin family peptidyl-prolyl cis-trans isomerase/uncharacterized protein (DUF2141 family)
MKRRLLEVFVLVFALATRADAQPPVITSQPQSITVNNASAAAFTVVASNAAAYQWQFQGTNSLPGATNATLSLDDVSSNQAGSYTVVVTSADNSSTNSTPAVLTVVPGTIVQLTISTYPDGGSSNFLVQLFDHDKPATVENFIHYITSGAYSNMFFDRDVTNFVLQGGDYVTSDRATNGLNVNYVSTGTNIFPSQVDSEFNVGPLIHNRFGTLAMALQSGNPNSATSAFFFNLTDNSSYLDTNNGGFTVFGRIISGTNVLQNGTNILQYFNTLSAPSNGICDLYSTVPTLPVNYDGTNPPTDASFFYCDFAFQTTPPVDTTPPTVSITFPAPNAALTNAGPLTALGTAQDDVGLAEVFCVFTPLAGATAGQSQTNAAQGTTNWSLDLGTIEPGVYQLTALAQDGAGNLSAPATEYFTNMVILTIITNADGRLTTNTQYLVPGQPYSVTAAPGAEELFDYWQIQGVVSLDPVQSFTAQTNLTLRVTLVSNTLPAGLAITSPVAGSQVQTTNAALTISGTLPSVTNVTQVTCQLFYQSNAVTAALHAVINGTNWSLAISNLLGGLYTIVVVAQDSSARQGLVAENFIALVAPPTIISEPQSVTNGAGYSAYFSVTAGNAVGYQWQEVGIGAIAGATNATLVLPDVTTNLSGSSFFVVLTARDGETVTSSPAVLTVVPGTLVQITFSGFPDGTSSNVLVQLFDHDKPATVANFLHYITPAVVGSHSNVAFSNMIWDRCIPGFVLQGGDYDALEPTNGTAPPSLYSVYTNYTANPHYTPRFPTNIANEFSVGPLIHNNFGSLAMAKQAGNPDSAANAFFFNLVDNSSNLDYQNGGFTVFGSLISGSNVLQYFNTLRKPNQGIFDESTVIPGASLTDLPVNYHGWGTPANSNLFFASFSLLSAISADTNRPTVSVSYPLDGATVTNADVVLYGTSMDDVAVANVHCTLAQTYTGFEYIEGTFTAVGTTNWRADLGVLAPGNYSATIVAQDGAGNLSSTVTNSFVVPRFFCVSDTNGNGTLSTNLNGTNSTIGFTYTIKAKPRNGSVFLNWTIGANSSLDPVQTFIMENGLQMTANFISNTMPANTIAFTYPAPDAKLTNGTFSIEGRVAASERTNQVTVTCQVFSASTSNSVTGPMVVNAANTWTTSSLPFAPGSYIVQAVARDALGRGTVIRERFTVLAPLKVITYGPGTASIRNGAFLPVGSTNTITATPHSGQSFLAWNNGSRSVRQPSITFVMSEGLTLTATFVSNALPGKLAFTYPKPGGQVTTRNFTVSGSVASSVASPQVVCQLFMNNSPVTDFAAATVSGTNWTLLVTNMAMGSYTAVAIVTDATGQSTLVSEKFTVNLFPYIAGSYHGLFFDPASISEVSAGAISLVLSSNGVAHGVLAFPLVSIPFENLQVGLSGSVEVLGRGYAGTEFLLKLSFDVTHLSGQMSGFVEFAHQVCPMAAYRQAGDLSTNTAPSTGKYVLSLQPVNVSSNQPAANSFAALTVASNGSVAVAGILADNSPFSFSTGISTNGIWPVYSGFFNGFGMLIGWETNLPSGQCIGTLVWIKGAGLGNYYTKGVGEELISIGTNYVAPPAGADYQIVFDSGTLAVPLTNSLTVTNGQLVPSASFTDQLAITNLSTGVITGTILNTNDNKTLKFKGVFLGPSQGGSGFILDTDKRAGTFVISPLP